MTYVQNPLTAKEPDKYMQLRRNTALVQRSRLAMARNIIAAAIDSQCFIPSENDDEIKLLDEIDKPLTDAVESINKAIDDTERLLRFYDDSLGTKTSETCRGI